MPVISMVIGIIAAPMIPHVGIIVSVFIACVLLSWLLRRWDVMQSIGILSCFVCLGMLVGQNVDRASLHHRHVSQRTEKQQLSRIERVQQRCLEYRQELLDRYRTQSSEEDEYAVVAAMTLGDKSALTKELRETYSLTGASHILALSGLHLGIIYLSRYSGKAMARPSALS